MLWGHPQGPVSSYQNGNALRHGGHCGEWRLEKRGTAYCAGASHERLRNWIIFIYFISKLALITQSKQRLSEIYSLGGNCPHPQVQG